MSDQTQSITIETPSMLDSIGGIPLRWFREIGVACDRFFADRGITYEKCHWKEDIHANITVAIAERESKK